MKPNRRFFSTLIDCTEEGIEPKNEFVSSHNVDKLTNGPMVVGIEPPNEFPLRYNAPKFVK